MKVDANMRIVNNDTLLAVGDVILDEKFVIHQVKVLNLKDPDGNKRPVVCMPRKKTKDGWTNALVVHDNALQEEINKKVVESVQAALMSDMRFEDCNIEIKITPYHGAGKLCAYADIIYEGVVEVKGIQIQGGNEGLKVVYPYNIASNEFQSLVGASTMFVQGKLDKLVIESYEAAKREQKKELSKRGQCL